MNAIVQETSYHVAEGEVKETTIEVEMSFTLTSSGNGELWVSHEHGPQSLPLKGLCELVEKDSNWLMQFGTPPVCVDGTWGGRNYSRMVVPHTELVKLKQEFA